MTAISINDKNISLLKNFIAKMGEAKKSFRYFNTRSIEVIKNHKATLMFADEHNHPMAYGHLDSENENVWLGLCVLPEYKGKGYGNKMMLSLLKNANELNVQSILLTVDKDNTAAIKMYEKFQFKLVEELQTCYKYLRVDS